MTKAPTYVADKDAEYTTIGTARVRHEYGCKSVELHATHLTPETWETAFDKSNPMFDHAVTVVDEFGGQMIIAIPKEQSVWDSCLGAPGDFMRLLSYGSRLAEDLDALHLRYDFVVDSGLPTYAEMSAEQRAKTR